MKAKTKADKATADVFKQNNQARIQQMRADIEEAQQEIKYCEYFIKEYKARFARYGKDDGISPMETRLAVAQAKKAEAESKINRRGAFKISDEE